MSVLADEDEKAERQPSLPTQRAPISRRIKEATRAKPPRESIVQCVQEPNRNRSHAHETDTDFERLLTPKEASQFLRLSLSWLAKARMRGDGPPYVKPRRAVRYHKGTLLQWMKSRTRLSTSEG